MPDVLSLVAHDRNVASPFRDALTGSPKRAISRRLQDALRQPCKSVPDAKRDFITALERCGLDALSSTATGDEISRQNGALARVVLAHATQLVRAVLYDVECKVSIPSDEYPREAIERASLALGEWYEDEVNPFLNRAEDLAREARAEAA